MNLDRIGFALDGGGFYSTASAVSGDVPAKRHMPYAIGKTDSPLLPRGLKSGVMVNTVII